MRVIVFFDLPMTNPDDMKEYRVFRKKLMRLGFQMLQESVYTKIAITTSSGNLLKHAVRKIAPKKGLIQVLMVTEKQYMSMETIIGQQKSCVVDSDERIIIL